MGPVRLPQDRPVNPASDCLTNRSRDHRRGIRLEPLCRRPHPVSSGAVPGIKDLNPTEGSVHDHRRNPRCDHPGPACYLSVSARAGWRHQAVLGEGRAQRPFPAATVDESCVASYRSAPLGPPLRLASRNEDEAGAEGSAHRFSKPLRARPTGFEPVTFGFVDRWPDQPAKRHTAKTCVQSEARSRKCSCRASASAAEYWLSAAGRSWQAEGVS
jgi:hypothetical protein